MHKEFLMGNAAIALGAVAAGVNVVAVTLEHLLPRFLRRSQNTARMISM